ncbi:MAG: sugar nucleotide-binding protein, partial [Planctomycetaceae bacterium]|nr:sugar nucleotide-binding protein [Planctomycetaceae bacterium]
MKIVIVGKNGLLGGALTRHALSLSLCEGRDFVSLDLPDFDAVSRRFALETLGELKPEVMINTIGVTMIDRLEKKPNTARTIHVQGTANLREAAKRADALLVQVSCAEVFGQTADQPAAEDFLPFSE